MPEQLRRCVIPDCTGVAAEDLPSPVCIRCAYALAEAFASIRLNKTGVIPRAVARDRAKRGGGWIYYLRIGDRIKIGHTVNLRNRLGSYPPDAVLLCAHPGTRSDEAALHQLFQSYCEAGREWYGDRHQPILDHIARMVAEHGDPADLALAPQRVRKPSSQHVAMRSRSGASYRR